MPVDSRSVTPGYFGAMSIPLREGRDFTDSDTADAPLVGIIDDRLARAAWPNQSPIGRRFRISAQGLPWTTIVGVVGHIRHDDLTTDPRPQVYWSQQQRAQDRMSLVVRADVDATLLVRPIIAEIRAVDPDQPVYDVRPMTAVVDRVSGQQWLTAATVATFAVVALVMSAIGVYGVMSYGTRLRAREFSIRIALGAARRDVLMLVIRKGLLLVGCGVVLGLAGSMFATRALIGLLHEVSRTDLLSFAAASGVLALAAFVATIAPPRRAVSVAPMTVLRGE